MKTQTSTPTWVYNDGGRAEAGYKGTTGDCVVRAIAIATKKPYQEVYDKINSLNKEYASKSRSRVAKRISSGKGQRGTTPSNGVFKDVYRPYLESLGWKFVPTMTIGSGCKIHLKADELPKGTIIVKVSKHLVTMVNGVLQDTHDCSRNGQRCVYGYYSLK